MSYCNMGAWAALILLYIAPQIAGQELPLFHAGVSEVHIDVGVVDRFGRAITGLGKDDFRVFDEGQERTLTSVATEEQPLDIILLLDASGSMRRQIARVASATHQAMGALRQGDRVSVITFTSKTRVELPLVADFSQVENSIREILIRRFRGGTQIREAIYQAASSFLSNESRQRRRAILVVSDNQGGHKRSEREVINNLLEADAVLSGIITPVATPRGVRPNLFVEYLGSKLVAGIGGVAEATGGEVFHSGDPGEAFSQMIHRIRSRYSLYYPTPDGSPGSVRSIRVELASRARLRHPDSQVLARKTYILKR